MTFLTVLHGKMIIEIKITGVVQGVGFRPFVYSKAIENNIKGFVKNKGSFVYILASGDYKKLEAFCDALESDKPLEAMILSIEKNVLENMDSLDERLSETHFCIMESEDEKLLDTLPILAPDAGICVKCNAEIHDKSNRRYIYPLISCTSCGPRYTVMTSFPYDRERTVYNSFIMCEKCSKEYKAISDNKNDRRHHAQTISCKECGPKLFAYSFSKEKNIYEKDNENYKKSKVNTETYDKTPYVFIERAAKVISDGGIVGIKSVGGFQLCASVFDDDSLRRLRSIKHREKKPFAVMFKDMDEIKKYAFVSAKEEELLISSARPIVLLRVRNSVQDSFSQIVSGESRYIGAFLPSMGLHSLLLDMASPLVVTSANDSGEPMITEDEEFLNRFNVDYVLSNDRPVLSPLDDSVLFVIKTSDDKEHIQFIRRARGYVPLPVITDYDTDGDVILAMGGDLKTCFAIGMNNRIILSQFFGDMIDAKIQKNYLHEVDRMQKILGVSVNSVVSDAHPSYKTRIMSEKICEEKSIVHFKVQHHAAHMASVMAEHRLKSAIGVILDGTGYGDDGCVWGGEILYIGDTSNRVKRVSHLNYVKLTGGDKVSIDADLCLSSYMINMGFTNEDILKHIQDKDESGLQLIRSAQKANINTVKSSSTGRLFDAVSALLNIRHENTYEGECAIALENKAYKYMLNYYPDVVTAVQKGVQYIYLDDLKKSLHAVNYVDDNNVNTNITDNIEYNLISQTDILRYVYLKSSEKTAEELSFITHMLLIALIEDEIKKASLRYKESNITLGGGCFANRILLEGIIETLHLSGLQAFWNNQVPANDSGISLGQLYLNNHKN